MARRHAHQVADPAAAGTVRRVKSTPNQHPLSTDQIVERLPERYSPSGMSQFMKCPLSFYYKYVLGLRSGNTIPTSLGSLCHLVLEDLFDLPAEGRTADAAKAMLPDAWARMLAEDPEYLEVIGGENEVGPFIARAAELIENYFTIETPSGFEPAARELELEAEIDGVTYRGIIDRLDEITVDGEPATVISDYKSGKKPKAAYTDEAFFAMRVYALLVSEQLGKVPSALRLVYISQRTKADGLLRSRVDDRTLRTIRAKIGAVTSGVRSCAEKRQFRAKPSVLCDWCDYKSFCPAQNPELVGVPLATEVEITTGEAAA